MSPDKIRLKTVSGRAELIRERLAAIGTLPLGSEAELSADPRMLAAGESFLWRSLESLFDIGRQVLSKGFGKVVPNYASVADELAAHGVLPSETAAKLRLMARYRNRMVHFDDEILPGELYGILARQRGDVEEVLGAIQRWLAAHPGICDDEL
jgi:uncharacterized protein YutE (UPF0331/DUF86 family)